MGKQEFGKFKMHPAERLSEGSASFVGVAVNRTNGSPVVYWVDREDCYWYSRFDGRVWEKAQNLETRGIKLPVRRQVDNKQPAARLALGSGGGMSLILSDGVKLYHIAYQGNAAEVEEIADVAEGSNPSHLEVFAEFDSRGRLHVAYQVERGEEDSRAYYAVRSEAGKWSSWKDVAGGRPFFAEMTVAPDDSVHIVWMGRLPDEDGLRNWQAFYRKRYADGKWEESEQATHEAPVNGISGPVAIHPSLAVGQDGVVHMVYPVDPDDWKKEDDGHACYTYRDENGWSEPVTLFTNALHAAWLKIAVSARHHKWIFGLNLRRRYVHETESGFSDEKSWGGSTERRFYMDVAATPAGIWLASLAGPADGPVEVIRFVEE